MEKKYKLEDFEEYLMSDDSSTFLLGYNLFKQHCWVQGLTDEELQLLVKYRISINVLVYRLYFKLNSKEFARFRCKANQELQKRNKPIKYELINDIT